MTDDRDKPLALLTMGPLAQVVQRVSEQCRPLLIGDIPDRSAFYAERGAEVRLIVSRGGYRITTDMLDQMPNLGLIACFGSGYEGVDIAEVRARGIEVTHAPNLNSGDVADIAIGLMIMTIRRLGEGDRMIRGGKWDRPAPLPLTPSLSALRYGIVGLGAIGTAIGERLEAFGGAVRWWGYRAKPDARWPMAESLLELATNSDVLLLAHRADESNRHLIDAGIIGALGPNGYLVNVARGSAVDEAALAAALASGGLAGAATDVFDREPTDPRRWSGLETISMSPHVGGWTSHSIEAAETLLAENIRRFLAGEPVATPVVV